MTYLLRGALVEYASDFLGPLPNVVVFQFNPETLTRVIQIPPRPTGATARETSQAGEIPVERITLKAQFSAAQTLGDGDVVSRGIARTVGVGPQLAALEQMVHPTNVLGKLIGQAIDAVGKALGLGSGGSGKAPEQPIPREQYPRILFIWGLTRVLPVIIESMSITEQQYDALLNPVEAEVTIGLAVVDISACSDDEVAKGAQEYTAAAQESLAVSNLLVAAPLVRDLIPF
ncbi:MAG TPA: hypothetical protein VGJ18_10205 [Gemmatimonadaceae bacterium]|jgi:hypothetical protein